MARIWSQEQRHEDGYQCVKYKYVIYDDPRYRQTHMVEIALFNINDISLLFSGFHALVLASLLFFSQQQGRIKQLYWHFLALFFFLGALRTFDTLVYWNINVRDTLSLVSANFFFLFGFAFFLSQIACLHQPQQCNKKGEYKNCKIVKMQWFLTILFASLICFNQRKRAAMVAGQKYVCELRYHKSRVLPKNSNLIKKGE